MKIRKIHFQLFNTENPQWVKGNGFKTQLFNTLSMFFPFGEGWFIKTFRNIIRADLIKDPELIEAVRVFTAQESMHTNVHNQFNDYLKSNGLPFTLLTWFEVRAFIFDWVHSHHTKLAITMAYEHITAVFAYAALSKNWMDGVEDENIKRMWFWHSAEEIEHKSVAFDVYRHIGGGYWRRQYGMLFALLCLSGDAATQLLINLYRTKQLFKIKTWIHASEFLFGGGQFAKLMGKKLILYTYPSWSPPNLGDDLAKSWLKENLAHFRILHR